MNPSPAVSVIIAVHNEKLFLDECLASLVAQTFTDWEIIACDDASTDGSWSILEQWAQRDPRINILLNAHNQGAAATRNRAIGMSRGRYIAIQDADDLSFAERLSMQVRYLNRHTSCAFVSTGLLRFDHQVPHQLAPRNRDFLVRIPYCHAATMFRREALVAVNGYRVSSETRRGQDYDLFMRLHAVGYQGHNLPLCLYGYREGQAAYQRRFFRYRIDEMIVRFKGFRNLGLLPWGLPFVLKPLFVGVIAFFIRRPAKRSVSPFLEQLSIVEGQANAGDTR
jgi:glycosyltransferase involved in cell wall biosynthesis